MRPLRSSHAAPFVLVAIAACAEPPPPPTRVALAPQAPVATAAPTTSAAPADSAPPAPPAPTVTPVAPGGWNRVVLEIRPGEPPCTFLFDAEVFDDHGDWFVAAAVNRIGTAAGGSCAAGVFYDFAKEPKSKPNEDRQPLGGAALNKPGHPVDPDVGSPNVLADLNFDGWADLCWVDISGGRNYSQRCWLFDPKARRYVRNSELDHVTSVAIDPVKKTLKSHVPDQGSYSDSEYAWENGKLVKTLQIDTALESPDGKPVAAGFYWVERRERRGGRLVKVSAGLVRALP